MVTLSYGRSFSRSVKTRVSHTYWRSAIHTMPLSVELLQCVLAKPSMQYRSPINLKSNLRSIPHSAQNCTHQHPLGHDKCPAQESVYRGCLKKGHWQAKYHSSKKNQSTTALHSQSKGTPGWQAKEGKKADLIGVHTEESRCDEIFLDNVCAPHTNEAYTTVCLLASASSKRMASFQVKVDTGASGNVLPLHLFRHLYPDGIDKTGHPNGLNVSNTRLTAYNGTLIPLFGSLHGPIIWQPGYPRCTTPPDKLQLVCGRHPWSSHTGVPIMWEIGSCQSELCCEGHPRHFPPAWSHSSTSNTHEDSSNQVYRGPHQEVAR